MPKQNVSHQESQPTKGWKPWGDHPIIVTIIVLTAIIGVAFPVFQSLQRDREVEYVGRVIDRTTQAPIRGAKVTLDIQGAPPIVYTDAEGVYVFPLVLRDEQVTGRIRIDADTYITYDRNITLSSNNTQIEDIRLDPIVTPAPAATSTSRPSPVSSPIQTQVLSEDEQAQALLAQARQWSLKFSYTFDGDAQGWPTPTFVDELGLANTTITSEGKYRWELTSKHETTWWVTPPQPVNEPVRDFYATIEIQKKPGSSETSSAGLLFRLVDNSNFYAFRVRSNARLFSTRSYSPNGVIPLPNMGEQQSLFISDTEPNTLTVIGQGPVFWFYINDSFVGKAVDDRFVEGDVLMAVVMPDKAGGEQATVEFDNFEVRVPPQ